MDDGFQDLCKPDNDKDDGPDPADRILVRVQIVQQQQHAQDNQDQGSGHALLPLRKRLMKSTPARISKTGQNLPICRMEMTSKLSSRKRVPANTRAIPPQNSMLPYCPNCSFSWSNGVIRFMPSRASLRFLAV